MHYSLHEDTVISVLGFIYQNGGHAANVKGQYSH